MAAAHGVMTCMVTEERGTILMARGLAPLATSCFSLETAFEERAEVKCVLLSASLPCGYTQRCPVFCF